MLKYCFLKTPCKLGPFFPREEYGSWQRSHWRSYKCLPVACCGFNLSSASLLRRSASQPANRPSATTQRNREIPLSFHPGLLPLSSSSTPPPFDVKLNHRARACQSPLNEFTKNPRALMGNAYWSTGCGRAG